MNAGVDVRKMILRKIKDKTREGLWRKVQKMNLEGWRILGTVFERNGGYRAVMVRERQSGGRRCSSHTATSSL